jgi:hypothetical protein
MTTGAPPLPSPASRRARSSPHSSPSARSTRTTSGRSSRASSTASADVQAVPRTRSPRCSRRPRATSVNDRLSSTTSTPHIVTRSESQYGTGRALLLASIFRDLRLVVRGSGWFAVFRRTAVAGGPAVAPGGRSTGPRGVLCAVGIGVAGQPGDMAWRRLIAAVMSSVQGQRAESRSLSRRPPRTIRPATENSRGRRRLGSPGERCGAGGSSRPPRRASNAAIPSKTAAGMPRPSQRAPA